MLGEEPQSQKYFGENYDELKAAVDALKASPPDFSGVITLYERWLSGGGSNAIGLSEIDDQHFFTDAQYNQWQEEVAENGVSSTWPDVTGIVGELRYLTSAGQQARFNLDTWMGQLHALADGSGSNLQPLLDALNKIRRWKFAGGRK